MGRNVIKLYNYIRLIPYSNLTNWSEQYQGLTGIAFKKGYPMVHVGDVLTRNKTTIDIKNDVIYKRARIKIRNGGIELREKQGISGNKIDTKKQYLITKGQFLLSKIDARNGAFGVVPDELDGGVITGNFWTFDVDYNQIDPHYLTLLTTTQEFTNFCEKASNGTTNRHYLQESLFLDIQIPLPDLEEQRAFVNEYFNKSLEAEDAEKQAKKFEKETRKWLMRYLGISVNDVIGNNCNIQFVRYRNLIKWSIEDILRSDNYSFDHAKYEVVKIGDVIISFEGGKTPSTKRKDYWGEDVYWVSAKDMKELYLINIQDKLTQKGVDESKLRVYPKWTILGVFRSGILRHSFPICLTAHPVTINQDLKAFRLDGKKTKKLYFMFYLNLLQDIVLNVAMKKGVTVESINADAFMNIPFVCPPMIKQSEIVRYIYKKKKLIYQKCEEAKQLRLQAIKDFETKIFM